MSGLPAGRVALAGSLSELVDHLLAATPRVRDAARQQALTDRHLAPALPAIETLLLQLRAELDPVLRAAQPAMAAKPYPLGQCLGITMAVQRRLAQLDAAGLSGPAAAGHAALRAFLQAGGTMRRAWGDLRGQYFQNALVVGALYVDVANDTVVPTKPKVEILPFAAAGFSPIADYAHYARIAGSYWGCRILPNHVLPELAPYLPLIQVGADGRVRLGSSVRYMLGLTLANGFAPSEQALAGPPLPADVFRALSSALRGGATGLAMSAAEGREAALARCRALRAGHETDRALEAFAAALAAAQDADRRLARLTAVPQAA